MQTHPPWSQEYCQSYPVGSNPGYVTHINRGLGHTQTAKGEYCNAVPDNCIDHKTFESISSFFQTPFICRALGKGASMSNLKYLLGLGQGSNPGSPRHGANDLPLG